VTELIPFPSDDTLAVSVAKRWLEALETVNHAAAAYCIALSGGRIARKFFAAVTRQAPRGLLPVVHFFWADERCVPPTDPDSNFGVARELLLAPLGIEPDKIHRIRGEIEPAWAAAEAEAEICRIAPMSESGQPVLDLVLLGMGEDGHVASLFPSAPQEMICRKAVYIPVVAAKPPPRRITINYPTIAVAGQVWVMASGSGKEAALRESLAEGGKTPLARVLAMRQQTVIFSDIPLEARG